MARPACPSLVHARPDGWPLVRSPNTAPLSPPFPALLHAFVLGPELLPPFPSVRPMDATALSQDYGRDCRFRPSPSFSSPPPTQRLRPIPMPPERAALLDATPPSEYPPFFIFFLLMMLPPQPRRFCRSQSGIAGCSRRAQRRILSLDVPTAPPYPTPTDPQATHLRPRSRHLGSRAPPPFARPGGPTTSSPVSTTR